MADHDRIRIFLFQGDPVAQAGLVSTLAKYPDLEVVQSDAGFACDLDGKLHLDLHCFDVAIADYERGIALAQAARGSTRSGFDPGGRVVIFAPNDREWAVRRALGEGVRGYILVGCPLEELVRCLRTVHSGLRYLSAQVAQKLADSLSMDPLTCREEQVLRLVVDGMNNKAIARRLGIAVGTVKSHMKGVFDKLSVDSRTKAINAAAQRGLLRELPCADNAARMSSDSFSPAAHHASAAHDAAAATIG